MDTETARSPRTVTRSPVISVTVLISPPLGTHSAGAASTGAGGTTSTAIAVAAKTKRDLRKSAPQLSYVIFPRRPHVRLSRAGGCMCTRIRSPWVHRGAGASDVDEVPACG